MVEVTDAVREAARDYLAEVAGSNWGLETIRDGMEDEHPAVQAFARIYQRGKLEGARLALEAAAGQAAGYINPDIDHNTLPLFATAAIRALDPAKIVGEG